MSTGRLDRQAIGRDSKIGRATKMRRRLAATAFAVAVGSLLATSDALAKNDFANGFEDQLGRIVAHQVAHLGHHVLIQTASLGRDHRYRRRAPVVDHVRPRRHAFRHHANPSRRHHYRRHYRHERNHAHDRYCKIRSHHHDRDHGPVSVQASFRDHRESDRAHRTHRRRNDSDRSQYSRH